MTKLLAITAAALLVASSAAYAGEGTCYGAGHSVKSVSKVPTQTPKPVATVQTASTSATIKR